ncbi:hypothetical protein K435DRAFT_586887, partial [Dendrothele bispora CBS 962.96]
KPPKKPMKPSTGPSQRLISRINHFQDLLRSLPEEASLANESESTYHFSLSPEAIEERGAFGAVSHCLEVGLGQHIDGIIHLRQRGRTADGLVKMLKDGVKFMSEGDRKAFESAWLERLIQAATREGARHPKRKNPNSSVADTEKHVKKKSRTSNSAIVITDSDSDEEGTSTLPSATILTAPLPSTSKTIPSSNPVQPSSQARLTKPLPKLKQSTLSFTKDTRSEEEKAEERRQRMLDYEAKQAEHELKAAREKERKKEHERELARNRQRKHREKLRAESSDTDENSVNTALMQGARQVKELEKTGVEDGFSVAEVSRAEFKDWRKVRNGTKGGATQSRAVRTNWYHPFLWVVIHRAMVRALWSPQGAVKILQRENHDLFQHLHRGTVNRWKTPQKHEWSEKTLQNVRRHHAILGSGRSGALAKFPELTDEIKTTLLNLRKSGMIVNVPIARSIMLGIIRSRYPHVLTPHFQCTEQYVRDFFQSIMNWSPRTGTRASAHLPADAEDICERALMRIVYAMKWYNVPPKLVINGDQMGVYVLPNSSRTFDTRGQKQIDVVAKEEKRAFTLFVASTADGDFLPFQQVWGGRSSMSTPSSDADGMDEALEFGFDLTFARSDKNPTSHFSTMKTMKEWLKNIIHPYIQRVIQEDIDLEPDQMSILLIDAYPVHTSDEFRSFIFKEYPNIILIYVPQNCTGKFQPADIGLQRPIKHFLKQRLFQWMADMHQEKISAGASPEDITVSTSIPILRNASVRGLVEVYKYMNTFHGKSLIQKAWKNCVAKEYNLSVECLTSKRTQTDLNKYLKKDATLRDEIEARCGIVHGLEDSSTELIEADTDLGLNDIDDDDVPLSQVI